MGRSGERAQDPLEKLSKQRAFLSFHPDSPASPPAGGVELHEFPRSSGRTAVFLAFAPVEPHPTAAPPAAARGPRPAARGQWGRAPSVPPTRLRAQRALERSRPRLPSRPSDGRERRRPRPPPRRRSSRAPASGRAGRAERAPRGEPGGAAPLLQPLPLPSSLRCARALPRREGARLGCFPSVAQPRASSRCHRLPRPPRSPPATPREAAARSHPGRGLPAERGAQPGPRAWEGEGAGGGLPGPGMEGMEEAEAKPACSGPQ